MCLNLIRGLAGNCKAAYPNSFAANVDQNRFDCSGAGKVGGVLGVVVGVVGVLMMMM